MAFLLKSDPERQGGVLQADLGTQYNSFYTYISRLSLCVIIHSLPKTWSYNHVFQKTYLKLVIVSSSSASLLVTCA